jgi:hypothetical protein
MHHHPLGTKRPIHRIGRGSGSCDASCTMIHPTMQKPRISGWDPRRMSFFFLFFLWILFYFLSSLEYPVLNILLNVSTLSSLFPLSFISPTIISYIPLLYYILLSTPGDPALWLAPHTCRLVVAPGFLPGLKI